MRIGSMRLRISTEQALEVPKRWLHFRSASPYLVKSRSRQRCCREVAIKVMRALGLKRQASVLESKKEAAKCHHGAGFLAPTPSYTNGTAWNSGSLFARVSWRDMEANQARAALRSLGVPPSADHLPSLAQSTVKQTSLDQQGQQQEQPTINNQR